MASSTPSRRNGDEKFDTIIDRLDTLESRQKVMADTQQTHIEKDHLGIEPEYAQALIDEHVGMVHDVGLTVELIAGKPIVDAFTGRPTGEREPGIADRVKLLEYNSNGGRGFSVRNRDKILIAGLTTVGLIAVELIRVLFI